MSSHVKWIDSLEEVYYYGNGIESESYENLGEGYRHLMEKIGYPMYVLQVIYHLKLYM